MRREETPGPIAGGGGPGLTASMLLARLADLFDPRPLWLRISPTGVAA